MSLSPGLRSGDAAGVGLPRGSRCGRDVPGTARSLHLLEAGAEGCREPSAPGMVWGTHSSLLLALLLCPARWLEPTGAGGSCGCVTAKGFWCCSASSPCKELGAAAALPGFLQHGFLVLLQFLAPQGAGLLPLAGREPGELLAVPQSCSGLVPSWPSWGLCGAGSRPGKGTGCSLMWHTGASKHPAAKGKRGKKGMGREDRAAAALRLDQCRPSGNLSQISGPGACAC